MCFEPFSLVTLPSYTSLRNAILTLLELKIDIYSDAFYALFVHPIHSLTIRHWECFSTLLRTFRFVPLGETLSHYPITPNSKYGEIVERNFQLCREDVLKPLQ